MNTKEKESGGGLASSEIFVVEKQAIWIRDKDDESN